jgi:transcriptional regulator with XRE-family HTH domain
MFMRQITLTVLGYFYSNLHLAQGRNIEGEGKMSADGRTRKLIFRLIESKGESQQQFADAIGATRSLVSQWKTEKSNSFSNSKYIGKIADHFGVTTDYLLGNTSMPRPGCDEEMNEYLTELKNRPEMRTLFKVSKNATKEDVEQAVKIIEALKKPNDNDFDE